ncbi:30S ribosomal protein S20 [Candidatus Cyrtobacter comes]|uniref:Small ribosomal subunit protein bS20 n=1 Tax=Candidatus Cyrtobacter comes TaxID=675776 RepID=A0ABU5L745_9RICK|nr:30S ribosomal protein S20 [Candidatus Cyrtobacter comes]MDZ5761695.1 30S ribosomal protein S20 [Candidatus Cyrtobacter comes]
MANHKSAEKAHKISVAKNARNSGIKSKVKTFITKAKFSLQSGNAEESVSFFRKAESEIMKAATKGVIKLRCASRKVSRLAKYMKNGALASSHGKQ